MIITNDCYKSDSYKRLFILVSDLRQSKTFDKSFKVGKMCIINIAKLLFHTNHNY